MKKTMIGLLLISVLMLSGCGFLENMPKPPKVTPYPTPEAAAAPEIQPETGGGTEEKPAAEQGVLIHIKRTSKDAYDPENHSERILRFFWDEAQVDSAKNPEAAGKMTETLATLQDAWYTGKDATEYDIYGYDAMLSAAEDQYTVWKEFGGEVSEFYATRELEVLRADSRLCVFMVRTESYLGGAHGSYQNEALVFDSVTGDRIDLKDLADDEETLKNTLVSEMLRLVAEDTTGYYEETLGLTGSEAYEESFRALLREGSWYPGEDAFHIFSDLYELGPYAAGITDFAIPYERLNLNCVPNLESTSDAVFTIRPLEASAGSVEILDRVAVAEEGENYLLVCEGRADALRIEQLVWYETWYPASQNYYCEYLQNGALQLVLGFPGDLPNTMLRYRDQSGEHAMMISLSGEDGSILLTKAEPTNP